MLCCVSLRCLLVDDSPLFLDAASTLLEAQGIAVVGVASTAAEALPRARELRPDVTIVDVDLAGESGFDVVRQLAQAADEAGMSTILTSTRAESELIDLVAVSPVLGFISKADLSGSAIRDLLADRAHGQGCRHEALVYSTASELVAGAVPFMREGLSAGDSVLVVMREAGRTVLREALDGDSGKIDVADAHEWYRSPEHALDRYGRFIEDRLERGVPRIRVVAEVIWPEPSAAVAVAAWKRYEAQVSTALAAEPVSFICAYDTRELPAGIITDARRTHPVLRTGDGARPSARYAEPDEFVRELEREVPELA
jgi:CheY-like chemotaxis protein